MQNLTPAEVMAQLDRYIIGQSKAKRAVAIALRNRYRRALLPDDFRDEVIPKNILMMGPTGVGKTEIARRMALLVNAPFLKVEATKFTEVGYVGRDVDSIVRDLLQVALRLVETEKTEMVKDKAAQMAVERIIDVFIPSRKRKTEAGPLPFFGSIFNQKAATTTEGEAEPPSSEAEDRLAARFRKQIIDGERDNDEIEIEVSAGAAQTSPFQAYGQQDSDEGGADIPEALQNLLGGKKRRRRVTVLEAKRIYAQECAKELLDKDELIQLAIQRTEQQGIVFIDEIDKIAGSQGRSGADVSREGVQRDLLPIIEGTTVNTKHGPVKTQHVLFIAAGAFHMSKPSDLVPELQGRLPIRVELDSLTQSDFERILVEPHNALVKQYEALLATEGVHLVFQPDAITAIASIAADINARQENIGARRLQTVLERVLEEVSFSADTLSGQTVVVDHDMVVNQMGDTLSMDEVSRYIL
ncbi:MAG: ATP-dependent protease ATPase subunit HslU [Armatimonadota bacterium]